MGKHHGEELHDLFHPPWLWPDLSTDEENTERGERAEPSPDRGGVPGVQPGDPAGRFRSGRGHWTYDGTL